MRERTTSTRDAVGTSCPPRTSRRPVTWHWLPIAIDSRLPDQSRGLTHRRWGGTLKEGRIGDADARPPKLSGPKRGRHRRRLAQARTQRSSAQPCALVDSASHMRALERRARYPRGRRAAQGSAGRMRRLLRQFRLRRRGAPRPRRLVESRSARTGWPPDGDRGVSKTSGRGPLREDGDEADHKNDRDGGEDREDRGRATAVG
jgi:hypothetical protein